MVYGSKRAARKDILFNFKEHLNLLLLSISALLSEQITWPQLESGDGERDSDFWWWKGAKCGDDYCNLLQLWTLRAYSFSGFEFSSSHSRLLSKPNLSSSLLALISLSSLQDWFSFCSLVTFSVCPEVVSQSRRESSLDSLSEASPLSVNLKKWGEGP